MPKFSYPYYDLIIVIIIIRVITLECFHLQRAITSQHDNGKIDEDSPCNILEML